MIWLIICSYVQQTELRLRACCNKLLQEKCCTARIKLLQLQRRVCIVTKSADTVTKTQLRLKACFYFICNKTVKVKVVIALSLLLKHLKYYWKSWSDDEIKSYLGEPIVKNINFVFYSLFLTMIIDCTRTLCSSSDSLRLFCWYDIYGFTFFVKSTEEVYFDIQMIWWLRHESSCQWYICAIPVFECS